MEGFANLESYEFRTKNEREVQSCFLSFPYDSWTSLLEFVHARGEQFSQVSSD